jgi:hypothetical protein
LPVACITASPTSGRKGNQRALGGLHLRQAAACRAQAPTAERIVAARVEDYDVELGSCALHLPQHQIRIEHLEVDVDLSDGIGANRHEVVYTAYLHTVTGIVEQSHVGALQQLIAEALHRPVEAGLIKVDLRTAANQREAERA